MSRFVRLEAIPWWNRAALAESTVLLAGVGAVGNEVLKNLALMGVGRIVLVDRDTVAVHNLTRSVLFRAEQAGEAKVTAAARTLRELAPDTAVHPLKLDVAVLSPALLARAHVAVGALDSLAAQVRLGRLCRVAGIPWIQGGLGDAADLFKVTLTTHPGVEGPCLECHLPPGTGDRLLAEELPRGGCAAAGTKAAEADGVPSTPMTASILGGLMALETLSVLHAVHGLPAPDLPPAWGSYTHWSLRGPAVHALRRRNARPGCPWHAPPRILPVDGPVHRWSFAALAEALGNDGIVGVEGHLVRHSGCPSCGAASDWRWAAEVPARCPACDTPDPHAESLRHLPAGHPLGSRTPEALGMPPHVGLRWFTPAAEWLVTWPGLVEQALP
ncbi:MAG: ThiF family adenylyltransferase [Candidatus Sericytochromatia bacterium]|nr:ThiF family adenylyltransferase [Candidatus Tanganyikabacteria bacterium]